MWRNLYKDYSPDSDWIKEKVHSGKGITGCEMHELNGWGEAYHQAPKPKKRFFWSLIKRIFKGKKT